MSPEQIREAMIEAHLPLIDEAGSKGVQILCMQEVFTQPYFCPSQDAKWYAAVEKIPEGPTTKLMQEYAKKHNMVIVRNRWKLCGDTSKPKWTYPENVRWSQESGQRKFYAVPP